MQRRKNTTLQWLPHRDRYKWFIVKSWHMLLPSLHPVQSGFADFVIFISAPTHNSQMSSAIRQAFYSTSASEIFMRNRTKGAARLPRAETQDDEQLYEITLFSECAVIPFWQKCYRLKNWSKWHAVRLTGGAFNTEDTNNYFNNLAYVAHHKHAYICQQIEKDKREREKRVGWGQRGRWADLTIQKCTKETDYWNSSTGPLTDRKLHQNKQLLSTQGVVKDNAE